MEIGELCLVNIILVELWPMSMSFHDMNHIGHLARVGAILN